MALKKEVRNVGCGLPGREEWIMSAPMLKNPVMANLAGALQALQTSGDYRNLSFSSTAGSGSGGPGGSMGGVTPAMFMMLIQETQATRAALESSTGRDVSLDFLALGRKTKEVASIRQTTGL